MNEIDRVVCRLRGDVWVVVWVCLGMALLLPALAFFSPNKNANDGLMGAVFSLMFSLPGLLSWAWVKKTYVVANANHLVISTIRHKVILRWDEITDFFLKKRDKKLVLNIEARGENFVLNYALTNRQELQDFVQQKAVASRSNEWESIGTRAFDEWPRVFRYKDTNIALMILSAFALTVLLVALQLSNNATSGGLASMWSGFLSMWNALSISGRIAFILTFLAMASVYPLLFLATRLPQARATKSYLQQTVTADLRGLTFQTPQEYTPIAWDRVLDYYLEPVAGHLQNANRCVIVTARGKYAFLSTIVDGFTLREIIKKYATDVKSKEWVMKPGCDPDNLKTPARFVAKVGEKVFHFRTRTARAMMWFLTFHVAAIPVGTVVGSHIRNTRDLIFAIICNAVLAAALFLVWLAYFKTHIVVDERGITTGGLRRERVITWAQIESYTVTGDKYFLQIEGSGQKVRILQMFTDMSDFKKEVQSRAINSRNQTWTSTTKRSKTSTRTS